MSFIPTWREALKASAPLFAPLLKEDVSLNLLYGLCSGALLWCVRDLSHNPEMQKAVQEVGAETSLPFLQMIVGGWADATPLVAARNLGSIAKGSPDLKVGLDALLIFFMDDLLAVKLIQPPKSSDTSTYSSVSGANVVIGSTQVIAGDLIIHTITQQKIRACPTAPKPPAHFVGRREELDHLKNLLRQGQNVAITAVHGTGGIGKTALALKLASELTDYSAVLWGSVGLDPAPVNTLIAWAKHADPDFTSHDDERIDPDKLALRVQALLTNLINDQCPGLVLMILDDVWEQDSLRAARLLQKAAPVNSVTLITTRSQHVSAQLRSVRVDLHPMIPADGLQMLRNLLTAYPEIPDDTLLDLAKVVGYHPLAMELAAGQVSLLERPVSEIDGLIARYQGGIPNGSPFHDIQLELGEDREDNLALVLSFSYDELKPNAEHAEDLRGYFRALGILAYDVPFSRVMCSAIWQSEAPAILDFLRYRALLTIGDDEGWYRQHPLLRAYARALLNTAQETDATFAHYSDHMIQLATQFETLPPEEWDSHLALQYPHILSVGDDLVSQTGTGMKGDLERAQAFAYSIRLYLFNRREVQRTSWLEMGLQATRGLHSVSERDAVAGTQNREAISLNDLGLAWLALGESDKALEMFEQSLPLVRAAGDRRSEAGALNNIGGAWKALGQTRKALKMYERVLPLYKAVRDRGGEATTLNNIGGAWKALGQTRKALKMYERALSLYKAVRDRSGEARTLNNIGAAWLALGETRKALSYLEQALPLYEVVGSHSGEAMTLNNIGIAWKALGEKRKALEIYERALPLYKAVGDRGGEAGVLNNIGDAWTVLEEPHKALGYLEQALPLYKAVEDRSGEATTLNNIGAAWIALEEPHKALEYLEQALPLYKAVEDRSGEAATLNNIGMAWKALEEPHKALGYLEQALPLYKAMGDRSNEAVICFNIGMLYNGFGDLDQAITYLEHCVQLDRVIEHPDLKSDLQTLERFKREQAGDGTSAEIVSLVHKTGCLPRLFRRWTRIPMW